VTNQSTTNCDDPYFTIVKYQTTQLLGYLGTIRMDIVHIRIANMNVRTPLRAALRRQSGLLRPSGQACRRFASSSSPSSSSLRTGSNEKRWQYGAITFLTLSTLFLSRSLVHSDAEVTKRSKDSESKHDDPYDKTHHPDEPKSFPHATATEGLRMISSAELSNHDTEAAGYWVAIDGVVWDVTEFIQSGAHPGGSKVLAQNTGRNATSVYKPLHPPGEFYITAVEIVAPRSDSLYVPCFRDRHDRGEPGSQVQSRHYRS
jgi:cytochrome b involved in lipid metabolism